MDVGDILDQSKIQVGNKTLFHQLYKELAILGSERLIHVLQNLEQCKSQKKENPKIPENHAFKVTKQMGILSHQETVLKAYNKFRAFESDITLYTFVNGRRIIFKNVLHPNDVQFEKQGEIGTLIYDSILNLLFFKLIDGWLAVSEVLVEKEKKNFTPDKFAKEFQCHSINLKWEMTPNQ